MNAKEKETSSPYSGLVGTGGERIVRCNHCMKTFEEHEIPDNDGIDVCPYCGKTDGLMDTGMAQMNAKEFIAKLSEEKGVDVTVAAVRHHARLGRIGYRNDGRWVFEHIDIERMMEYAGKQGPKKGLVIRELVWTEENSDGVLSCHVLGCTLRILKDTDMWHWNIVVDQSAFTAGRVATIEQAKVACENAWHDLLMRDVLEVGR